MQLRFAARTDIGCRRQANEDFLATVPERGLFVVADGLGGHVGGRHAAETGVASFLEHTHGQAPSPDVLRGAVRVANAVLLAEAERHPELRGMGTTLVALWLADGAASLVNVGDSRAYLLREDRLTQLTLDHSMVSDLVVRGELDPGLARDHPNRHVITRALGVASTVEPDIGEFRVRKGDRFLLCSDGISAQLSDEEIKEIAFGSRDLEQGAQALVVAANGKGGEDNASVVLVGLY